MASPAPSRHGTRLVPTAPLSMVLVTMALALGGCNPQDAEVEGNFFAWLSTGSSPSVVSGDLDAALKGAVVYECAKGWNKTDQEWDLGYVGPREGDDLSDPKWIGGACPEDENGEFASYCADFVEEMDAECERINNKDSTVSWLGEDSFYGMKGELDPWRSWVTLNGEGDLQLAVHHDLGNGQDMRFQFVISSDYAPIECVTDESGEARIEYIDDARWEDEYSADEDGYTIYYLNAGAAQPDPVDDGVYWYLPAEWISGVGYTKFGGDEGYTIPPDYFNGVEDHSAVDYDAYLDVIATTQAAALLQSREMTEIAGTYLGDAADPSWRFTNKVEDNLWRPVSDFPGSFDGLDGWVEQQHSWVRVKNGSKMEAGGEVEGDYQIYMQGVDSSSRFVLTGKFKTLKIREDTKAYDDLEAEIRGNTEIGGNEFCGGAPGPE